MKYIIYTILTILLIIGLLVFLPISSEDVNTPDLKEETPKIPEIVINDRFSLIQNTSERDGDITHIMIHFMSNVVANPNNPYVIEDNVAILERYGLSIHYIIDRDGIIYKLVPEELVAWHAGNGSLEGFPNMNNRMNNYSIGIELLGIGTEDEMTSFISREHYRRVPAEHIGFTHAQYESLNNLLNDILRRNPTILPNRNHIVGHSEWTAGIRPDPGELFNWKLFDFNK